MFPLGVCCVPAKFLKFWSLLKKCTDLKSNVTGFNSFPIVGLALYHLEKKAVSIRNTKRKSCVVLKKYMKARLNKMYFLFQVLNSLRYIKI